MLEAKNIYKTIEKLEILKDINIKVEPSKISCLIGPSGGGKSTVLSCLSLITEPSSGKIILDELEYDFESLQNKKYSFPYPMVTLVFQGLFLFPHLTNKENISLPLKELKRNNSNFDSLIDRLMIRDILHKYPNECSGGEKQRVALARQILLEPKYLLLDEITSALDIETVNTVADILCELRDQGTGILLVTHMISFAKRISNNFYFMDKGKIVEYGEIKTITNPQTARLKKILEIYN